MHDFAATLSCLDSFLGDLNAKGLISLGKTRARVAPFVVPKNDGRQRLIFDTRQANKSPFTFLQRQRTLRLQAVKVSRRCSYLWARLFSRLRVTLSVAFTKCGYQVGWLGQFFGLSPIARRHLPRWLQGRVDSPPSDVVEFHSVVVPMDWNWAVWFVQQMLEHLLPRRGWSSDIEAFFINPTLG